MQTLLSVCRTERDTRIPQGYFRNGWNSFLPMGMCSLLLSIVNYISCDFSEKEISKRTTQEASMLQYVPFSFQFPIRFSSEEEKSMFFKILERETRVSAILERTGVGYPKSVRQAIDLLLYSGILLRTGRNNTRYLDAVIDPYPYPEEVLRLTPAERYQVKSTRNLGK